MKISKIGGSDAKENLKNIMQRYSLVYKEFYCPCGENIKLYFLFFRLMNNEVMSNMNMNGNGEKIAFRK